MKYDLVAAHRRCVAAAQGVRPRQATLLLAFATCILVASHPSARARGCLPADTDCPPNVSVVDKTNAAKAGKDPVVVAREDDEIAIYDDLLTRFGSATDPALREPVAKALLNKGLRLGVLGRVPEELATLDDLIARFGTATEPALREQVARTLLNKGYRLGMLGRGEDEIAVYDDLLARFGTAAEPALREQVAKAMLNKGFRLGKLRDLQKT